MTIPQGLPPVETDNAELYNGDRMTQEEFHAAYLKTPDGFRAELIGGIVYVASPLKLRHGRNHLPLGTLFFLYEAATSGVEASDNTTVLLGEDSEMQPDLLLRILPDHGGQSGTTPGDYVGGAPELIAEISHTSKAIDLHAKRDDYKKYGVLEYLVVSVKEKKLRWFDMQEEKELSPDADGVYRIRRFPGLWIHGAALLARDAMKLVAVLQQGIASPEHAAFVERLKSARKPNSP